MLIHEKDSAHDSSVKLSMCRCSHPGWHTLLLMLQCTPARSVHHDNIRNQRCAAHSGSPHNGYKHLHSNGVTHNSVLQSQRCNEDRPLDKLKLAWSKGAKLHLASQLECSVTFWGVIKAFPCSQVCTSVQTVLLPLQTSGQWLPLMKPKCWISRWILWYWNKMTFIPLWCSPSLFIQLSYLVGYKVHVHS